MVLRTRNAKKALFIGVLSFAFSQAFTLLDSKSGYRPFHRNAVPATRYGTLEDTVPPITDDEFTLLMRNIGCEEYALAALQQAQMIRRYKIRTHHLNNNEFLKLLREDRSLTEKQVSCALMAYSYRNNATMYPLKLLKQSEVETLMISTMNSRTARLIFSNALEEERMGNIKVAKFQLKCLTDSDYVRQHEPAINILADVEYNALLTMKE